MDLNDGLHALMSRKRITVGRQIPGRRWIEREEVYPSKKALNY
jgi:hypothetical protein